MSKAFTKDDDGAGELLVVPRAPLPAGLPNYVTPRGLAALRAEELELERERERAAIDALDAVDRMALRQALGQRLAELQARITSAAVVDPGLQPHDEVRFGATVCVRSVGGEERAYEIVGVDEADAEHGRIAFSSPLARALLGKRRGDSAELRTPRATEELEVVHITYPAPAIGS
jgi:transcription elongation factor GreB